MTPRQKQQRMHVNSLIDMEETMIKLRLKQDPEFRLQMLCAYRPDATLRQIKNSIPKE